MANTGVWFNIPVQNIERATKFYSALLAIEMIPMECGDCKSSLFPFQPGEVSGTLTQSDAIAPSESGTTIYLNGGDDLSISLGRVESSGGTILQEKMDIGEHGFIAYFRDTEGNRVALHSPH